ncbi:aromatic ring-hydroxylating dioxygenase subunit alpha [Planosporangium thailandense]|uniref:Aromatic ring-hydroxylating dioxygenase subunit alpha n=1 Tax=Planosporangium thailandense TaxID=765197 RepID=A0ABX0Y1D4_9ACTN|nr:aromatic ring-hydroxylating dioxygenase subunit alpha [Planosporangium thailandense]NJC71380.1 aromatic ring-hydroxylating dioxygenase subunit alpha [Planosporangium thailandense]
MFVRNAWYVIAWSEEITREPMKRTVLGQDVVLYRKEDGTPVALADRCAHRAYPLSAGRVIGDNIQCGYHGFEYDCEGVCVRVPAQDRIPARALVQKFPLVESHRWVWIWLGDADKAAATPVPDTHWMTDTDWDRVTHTRLFRCNANLLHDNLLDLTHEAFIHTSSIGDDAVYTNGVTVEVDGNVISVDRFMPNCHPSPLFEKATGIVPPCDRWHTTEFQAPSVHIIHAGVVEPGGRREDGYRLEVLNAITPQTEDTSWYFYAFCRNFAVGDEKINDLLRENLGGVLTEDDDALALQQHGIANRPATLPDVLIAQDAGVAKARRVMARLLAEESASTVDAEPQR